VTAPPEVVAKTSARDIAERRADLERADVEAAADQAVDEVVVVPASSAPTATRKKAATKKATRKKAATKKAAKKSTRKKAATKKAAKKSTRKKATKATGATTGAAARDILRSIKGVGPAKQDALLKQYKSIEAIKAASVDEIASLDGLGPTAAKKIKDAL
jgi:predicted flap endonuclease-1-like 5' DNA nuclease